MRRSERWNAVGWLLLGAALLLGAGMLLSGCTRTVYEPVEHTVVRTDTVYAARSAVDSIVLRDSVAVVQRGDTVYVSRWRERWRVRERTDTVYRSAVDSVRVEVPYPVEKKLSRWEQAKMDLGGVAIGVLAAVACIAVVWLIKKFRE